MFICSALGTWLRKRAFTTGRPLGANGVGLAGGEESVCEESSSGVCITGAQSVSDSSPPSRTCQYEAPRAALVDAHL